jgi:hypothetical protein
METKVFFWGGNIQVWTNDDVPGGIVRITWDQGKSEALLKSFSGMLAKTIPTLPDMTAKKELSKLTCKLFQK